MAAPEGGPGENKGSVGSQRMMMVRSRQRRPLSRRKQRARRTEPQGHSRHNPKADPKRPLSAHLAVRRRTAAVEDEEENDEDTLVEQLTPAC